MFEEIVPVFLCYESAKAKSKEIEIMADTIRIRSMKSSSAPMKSLQKGVLLGGALKLVPKCIYLSSKSTGSRPFSKSV